MNALQIKNSISIVNYLAQYGNDPVKQKGNLLWYLSPTREEKTASFSVNIHKNTFVDWGTGQRGSIIDLVMIHHNVNVTEAIRILNQFKCESGDLYPFSFYKQNISEEKNSVIDGTIEKISNPNVINYLETRGISKSIWKDCKFLYQYTYERFVKEKNKNYLFCNLAWKNDSNGYELSNYKFKGCLLKKDITTILGVNTEINIFEGFFDYLSALVYFKKNQLKGLTVILNSVTSIDKIYSIITSNQELTVVNSYLDNDKAGEVGIEILEKWFNNVINKSKEIYPNYNDFNEFLIEHLKA